MGCSQSIPEDHPTMFKAKNVDGREKPKNTVILEVDNQKLIVHSKQRKMMASWPILCLHRYGFNNDLLLIETGNGCDTGQGLFLFRCNRATQIFDKLKAVWGEIQDQNSRAMSIAYPNQMSVTTETTAVMSASYYNTTSSGSNGIPLTGIRHHPSTSNSHYTPPTPGTRGSASSHITGASGEMMNGSEVSLPAFELQPAPIGRQEMLNRRRINSNMVQFSKRDESVTINRTRHHTVAADCEYENSDVINEHKDKRSPEAGNVVFHTNNEHVSFRRESPELPPRGVSANSLRSDGEHVPLTPVSNSTSGIGSLNGNSTTSEGKCNGGQSLAPSSQSCQQPPLPAVDPWRKQVGLSNRHQRKTHPRRIMHTADFTRLSPSMPMSARDYVNTANASLDVGGTPLPATAAVGGGNHFSFDFDPRLLPGPNSFHQNSFNRNINYVPIEVSTKNGDFYSCGASSASSGLGPGTPLTPRTPGGQHMSTCEYTEIDHQKTRALSDAFRSRQRERKSRHASSETAGLMNGL